MDITDGGGLRLTVRTSCIVPHVTLMLCTVNFYYDGRNGRGMINITLISGLKHSRLRKVIFTICDLYMYMRIWGFGNNAMP